MIRPYRPADQPQHRALHDRTSPDGNPPSTGIRSNARPPAATPAGRPERQRQAIGARLTEAAVAWSRDHGDHALVVETNPQQTGAIGLYRHLGLREAGRSMIGPFELAWFDLSLQGT